MRVRGSDPPAWILWLALDLAGLNGLERKRAVWKLKGGLKSWLPESNPSGSGHPAPQMSISGREGYCSHSPFGDSPWDGERWRAWAVGPGSRKSRERLQRAAGTVVAWGTEALEAGAAQTHVAARVPVGFRGLSHICQLWRT